MIDEFPSIMDEEATTGGDLIDFIKVVAVQSCANSFVRKLEAFKEALERIYEKKKEEETTSGLAAIERRSIQRSEAINFHP